VWWALQSMFQSRVIGHGASLWADFIGRGAKRLEVHVYEPRPPSLHALGAPDGSRSSPQALPPLRDAWTSNAERCR
jgi:hypothetical protein